MIDIVEKHYLRSYTIYYNEDQNPTSLNPIGHFHRKFF